MRLSDIDVRIHLRAGGRLVHPTLLGMCLRLHADELWWEDRETGDRLSVLESYSFIASLEWEILGNKDSLTAGWGKHLEMDPVGGTSEVFKPESDGGEQG